MTRSRAPIDVMVAIPALDHGGPDRVMFELLKALDRERFRPTLLVSDERGYYLSRLPSDVRVTVLEPARTRLGRRYPVARAVRQVWRHKPDVVLATLGMILTLGMATRLLPSRTRLIVRPANDFSADFAELIKRSLVKHRLAKMLAVGALREAHAVVCQSSAMENDLRPLLRDGARVEVIGNPIDVDNVVVTDKSPATLPGHPALIGVGRLVPQKGFDLLLDAIARLRTRHPDLHLTIVGDGPDRHDLAQRTHRLGLDGHVTFRGFMENPVPLVHAADAFVLASRYEGFPNAALEALACGTPVLLTDCPGANSDLVHAGTNGRLSPSLEPVAIAAALDTLISELPSYDRSGIRDDCRVRFSSRRIVGQYERLISEMAA